MFTVGLSRHLTDLAGLVIAMRKKASVVRIQQPTYFIDNKTRYAYVNVKGYTPKVRLDCILIGQSDSTFEMDVSNLCVGLG